MVSYSDKTRQWIYSFFLIYFLFLLYFYCFFRENFLSYTLQLTIPILIWEVIIFAAFAPDAVITEIVGEESLESYRNYISSPLLQNEINHSRRFTVTGSGDY